MKILTYIFLVSTIHCGLLAWICKSEITILFRYSCLNCKTKPGADHDTDHIYLETKLRLKTYRCQSSKMAVKHDIEDYAWVVNGEMSGADHQGDDDC